MTGTLPKTRDFFNRSHRQLRRARRLYFRMIRGYVALDRTGGRLAEISARMQAVGLYSKHTRIGDIQFMILKQMYLFDRAGGARFDNFEHWRKRNGWVGWVFHGFARRQISR